MIYYDKGSWFIKDGGKEKASGSGTWLYVETKYEIKEDCTFKVGPSTMKLEKIEVNKDNK